MKVLDKNDEEIILRESIDVDDTDLPVNIDGVEDELLSEPDNFKEDVDDMDDILADEDDELDDILGGDEDDSLVDALMGAVSGSAGEDVDYLDADGIESLDQIAEEEDLDFDENMDDDDLF